MSEGDVGWLTRDQAHELVIQLLRHQQFIPNNPHPNSTEIESIKNFGIWPQKPVFSPYSVTHSGYSQIRAKGVKFSTHRVAYQSHYGNLQKDRITNVSHFMWLGSRTSTNINPLFLVQEPNHTDQTRKACHLAIEYALIKYTNRMKLDTEVKQSGEENTCLEMIHERFASPENYVCTILHGHQRCQFDINYWWPSESLELESGGEKN